jgi:hypothetical protein
MSKHHFSEVLRLYKSVYPRKKQIEISLLGLLIFLLITGCVGVASKKSSPTPFETATPTKTATTETTPTQASTATATPTKEITATEEPKATEESTATKEAGEYLDGKDLVVKKDWKDITEKDLVEFPLEDIFSGKLAENLKKQMKEQNYDPLAKSVPTRNRLEIVDDGLGTSVDILKDLSFDDTYGDKEKRFQKPIFVGETVLPSGQKVSVIGIYNLNWDGSRAIIFYAINTDFDRFVSIWKGKGVDSFEDVMFYPVRSVNNCADNGRDEMFCELNSLKGNDASQQIEKLVKSGCVGESFEGMIVVPTIFGWKTGFDL